MSVIDLEVKSKELKDLIGKYESDGFISQVAELLLLTGDGPIPYQPFHLLHSPMRQLYYLGALNITSFGKEKYDFNSEVWKTIIQLLNEIDQGYEELFIDKTKILDDQELEKIRVSLPTFLNYYNTGPINYEEQEIERIERYFSPFSNEIEVKLGLKISDFVDIYNEVDEILHKQLNKVLELLKHPKCEQFWNNMKLHNVRPNLWQYTGDPEVDELILFMKDHSEKLKIAPATIASMKDAPKAKIFFNLLSCSKHEEDYLFYTQPNIWIEKPIFNLSDGRFLVVQIKQIIHGVFNLLFNFCKSINSDRLYKIRGQQLELKIQEIFRNFFDKDVLIFKEYKTKLGKGQDLLILYKGLALIIEAKSTRRDAPYRNIEAAYKQIVANFNESLQYGYDQTFRVKELFLNENEIEIFDRKGNLLHTIISKSVHNVFSIVVTLEKFGQLQTDLGILLEVYETDDYPWSISIDDLEVFLLTLKKYNRTKVDLIRFLNQREKLHTQLECNDELEICGEFIINKNLPLLKEEQRYKSSFQMGDIFENLYEKGMGFEKEKQLERKTSGKYLFFHPHKMVGMEKKGKSKPFITPH